MEQQLITGIAHDKNDAKITMTAELHQPGSVAAIFSPLADAGIKVDMIVQNVAHSGDSNDITITGPPAERPRHVHVHTAAQQQNAQIRTAAGRDRGGTSGKIPGVY